MFELRYVRNLLFALKREVDCCLERLEVGQLSLGPKSGKALAELEPHVVGMKGTVGLKPIDRGEEQNIQPKGSFYHQDSRTVKEVNVEANKLNDNGPGQSGVGVYKRRYIPKPTSKERIQDGALGSGAVQVRVWRRVTLPGR